MSQNKKLKASEIYQQILDGKNTTFEIEIQKSTYYRKKNTQTYIPSPLTVEEGYAWKYGNKYYYKQYNWDLDTLFSFFKVRDKLSPQKNT